MIKSISFWEKESFEQVYDLIIIGAGFVGLSAAISYKEQFPDKNVLLLERGVIAYGASTRNAGFSCFGSIGELEDDLRNGSLESIIETVKLRHQGLQKLRSLVPRGQMDYAECGSVELFDNQDAYEAAADKISYWNEALSFLELGDIFHAVDVKQGEFYSKGISNPFEGQLNPKKAVDHLVKTARLLDVEIQYGLEVLNYLLVGSFCQVNTKEGLKFRGKRLLLATNAFTNRLIKGEDVQAARNQVLITEEIDNLAWKGCFHVECGYIYFRNVGNRILLGGARHISKNERVDEYGNTEEMKEYLSAYLKDKILGGQKVEIDHWWSGILGIGEGKMPIVKKIEDGIYIAVRLGGMGVAIGTLIGMRAVELIGMDEE